MHNIDTGERMAMRGDEKFPTASLIKVTVLVTLFDLVEKGQISLDDPLTIAKIDKVPGSGTLRFIRSASDRRGSTPRSFLAQYTSVVPDSSAKYGLGVTTPNEMARLFIDNEAQLTLARMGQVIAGAWVKR